MLQAGLCSRKSCPALKRALSHTPYYIDEQKPEKLSLALEPESAAIFCQHNLQRHKTSVWEDPNPEISYLIIDIGGGTVDVSAHCLVRGIKPHICVLYPPTGNDCGGVKINREFEMYLENLVKDPNFSRLLSTTNSKKQGILSKLIHEKFELQKRIFGENFAKYKGGIELPSEFYNTYEADINQTINDDSESTVKLIGHDLRISSDVMSKFFDVVLDDTIKCINKLLKDIDSIRYIYLVGGLVGASM